MFNKAFRSFVASLAIVLVVTLPYARGVKDSPKGSVESGFEGEDREDGLPGPELLDATFVYDANVGPGGVQVTVHNPVVENVNAPNLRRISEISSTSFGVNSQPWTRPPKSFSESLVYVEGIASTLKKDEKLLLLSMAGEKLGRGYDQTLPTGETSLDQLFFNAQSGGVRGGVCRDIHAYISEYAEALGFKNTGMFNFAIDDETRHQVSYYQDPATGEYLIQDYYRIINTGKNTMLEALDIATSVEGVLTEITYIGTKAGVRAYTPSPTRWITKHMKEASRLDQRSMVSLNVGRNERTFQLALSSSKDSVFRAKGFYLHSDYQAEEGMYRLDMFGVAGGLDTKVLLDNPIIHEVGLNATAMGGRILFQNPLYLAQLPSSSGEPIHQSNMARFGLKGYAKVDRLTGSLIVEGSTVENTGGPMNAPYTHQIRPQLTYQTFIPSFLVEIARSLQLLPKSMLEPGYALKTVYDQVSVVIDGRNDGRNAYLYFRGDYYLFDGISGMSAEGVKGVLRAAIPSETLGEFAVVLETSKMLKNRIQDPYYDALPYGEAGIEWMKRVGKSIEVGSGVSVGNGRRPSPLFENSTDAIPTVNGTRPVLNGDLWIRFKL